MTKLISYKQQQAANLQQQKLAEWGGEERGERTTVHSLVLISTH
jgi:hypothetical protein